MKIAFSNKDSSCGSESSDYCRVACRTMSLSNGGRGGRRNSIQIDDVLNGDWNAVQESSVFAALNFLVGSARLGLGVIG